MNISRPTVGESRNPSEPGPDGSGAMFDRIAPRYDLLNRINSFGLDGRWRKQLVRALELQPHHEALDVATGTADVALALARAAPGATVIGVDPSAGMLEVGREKVVAAGLNHAITLCVGDAQTLPFDDQRFDRVTIAFGIRNVPDRPRALSEMARVLAPGGRLAVLELSEPHSGALAFLARAHVRHVVPAIGALLTGGHAYAYLRRSIEAFPRPREFAGLVRAAGLEVESVLPMTWGACVLYVATRARAG